MLNKFDNNTIAIVGLVILGGLALAKGNVDVGLAVVTGVAGFIGGTAIAGKQNQ